MPHCGKDKVNIAAVAKKNVAGPTNDRGHRFYKIKSVA
jgi:hypothetical protein